jgi:hypothetical protein
MQILEHFNKDNLHHAYLLEGSREQIIPEILTLCQNLNIQTSGNPDFCHISIDNFKIDEALDLRGMSSNKAFIAGKKIFVISTNTISIDAQNVLLKMFEEPIENTHFFMVVPDTNALLKTLVSRFYLISPRQGLGEEVKNAENFLAMPLTTRINFIKEFLIESEKEDVDGNEIVALDSTRSKSIRFLNSLEYALHNKFSENYTSLTECFEHFFKVREFLRMPGSSTKSLMESVALITPVYKNI